MLFSRKRAILIGADRYNYIKTLDFCGDDAREIGKLFRSSLQFDNADILEFTLTSQHKPERQAILHHLGQFLKGVAEDELLVFYFSGHGMIDQNDGRDYLLPVDASPDDLGYTGLQVEWLANKLTNTKCKNIVMFIDACREALEGEKGLESIGANSREAVQRNGIVTFFSCNPKQKSYEIQALKHGSFTHCILQAITEGECNTVDEIDEYLRKCVPLINEEHKKPAQTPYTIIEPREKGQLAIFYSEIRGQKPTGKQDSCLGRLAELFIEEQISTIHLNEGTILLERASKGRLDPVESQKLKLLEQLCAGELHPKSFKAVWEVILRRQLKSPSPPKELDPPR